MNQELILLIIRDLGLLFLFAILLWLLSVKLHDASIADIYWGSGFIVATTSTLVQSANYSLESIVIYSVILLWGGRLTLHMWLRHIGKPEDKRYQEMRRRYGKSFTLTSFSIVFLLQSTLLFLISFSARWGIIHGTKDTRILFWLGISLALFGVAYESIADYQLQHFRNKPENKGNVLNRGLWAFSRHPNYFGETLVWWGLFIAVIDDGFSLITIFSPTIITFLLLKVSGVTLLEKHMKGNRSASYQAYIDKTSAFIPWFKKSR